MFSRRGLPLSSAMLLSALLCLLASPEPPPVLQRVGLIGASVTAGFGLRSELGGLAHLGDFLAAALREPGQVRSFGDLLLFESPVARGQSALAKLARFEPTLVIAADFLFWFGYGAGRSEEERARLFEQGLELLAGIQAPLVVGDLPDMSAALEGRSELTGGPFLTPDMIPGQELRARLNDRLRAFAAEREGVVVLSLEGLLRAMRGGGPLELPGGFRSEPVAVERLFQADRLHPSALGTAFLAQASLRALLEARGEPYAELLLGDLDSVVERVRAPIAARRKASEARRRERSEEGEDAGALRTPLAL
jgi:hypothetical protein